MSYKLSNSEFDNWLQKLADKFRLIGPVRVRNRGTFSDSDLIRYGEIGSLSQMELNAKSSFSPKEYLFPIRETLFRFNGANSEVPEIDPKPVIVFLRPCDINGIHRLDKVFLENGPQQDFYYQRRREKIKFFMIECTEGFNSCFCVSMKSNKTEDYAVALRFGKESVELDVKEECFDPVLEKMGRTTDFQPDFIRENKTKVQVPDLTGVDLDALFNHPLWKDYTERCIACGRCNTSCITCSCFTMQDSAYDSEGLLSERRRVWAGCHIDGFTDMAGGHTFRKNKGDRMRFKTMHKIDDFSRRFGFNMCVGCGRCDDVCPEYISFAACINKLHQISGELKNDK